MTALVPLHGGDPLAQVFAPVDSESIAGLLTAYNEERSKLERIAGLFGGDLLGVVHHFVEGNADEATKYGAESIAASLFKLPRAVASLNSKYWRTALALTDVLTVMDQASRDEWHTRLQKLDVPDFDAQTIMLTLGDLLAQRPAFFAKRVDGVFRSLSHTHVTNSPMGFRKRMILNGVTSGGYFVEYSRAGVINDLRAVIAKIMGMDEPAWRATEPVIKFALHPDQRSQWVTVDGGALRLRAYLCGTVHIEVDPEMACTLNQVLHSIYPTAIASEHRTPPKRKAKTVKLFSRPIPFAVRTEIAGLDKPRTQERPDVWTRSFSYRSDNDDKHVQAEAVRVLEAIGGVRRQGAYTTIIDFDYDPTEAIGLLVSSGCIPDVKAHQYYPTPPDIAQRAVDLACIGADDRVLEPSAGQGALACLLPADRTTCIEVSALHCAVLRAKGLDVVEGDALIVTPSDIGEFDVVVTNPPYDRGQWRAHVEHAAEFLPNPGARLVAVLPESAAKASLLPGWSLTWSEPMEFAGTSIRVVILVAVREP